ncbi:hypothetical protein [Streptomyces sp. NPDC005573]|uniref:hypothetical protein n=1 Tax=unclassified Streptomyces TaxID=2593676 RepID=UPI0033AEFC41
MHEFELQRFHTAELRRAAQQERLAREVVRAGRATRRAEAAARRGGPEAGPEAGRDAGPHTGRAVRSRPARSA